MELIVLGSGSALSGANRCTAGYVLKTNKEPIILDFGYGCFKQMQRAGVDYKDINNILLSHLHPDHTNDILALYSTLKCAIEFGEIKSKTLNIYGPKGVKEYWKNLERLYYSKNKALKVNVKELENSKIKLSKATFEARPMAHGKINALGFKISAEGKSVVYSGDSDYSANLLKLAKNSDISIFDCSHKDNKYYPGHLTPTRCAELAAKANVKSLMLTHFYPDIERVNIKKIVQKIYKRKILIAKDLMRVRI